MPRTIAVWLVNLQGLCRTLGFLMYLFLLSYTGCVLLWFFHSWYVMLGSSCFNVGFENYLFRITNSKLIYGQELFVSLIWALSYICVCIYIYIYIYRKKEEERSVRAMKCQIEPLGHPTSSMNSTNVVLPSSRSLDHSFSKYQLSLVWLGQVVFTSARSKVFLILELWFCSIAVLT